jgi:hypothetical protein
MKLLLMLSALALAAATSSYDVFYQASTRTFYTVPPLPQLAGAPPAPLENDVHVCSGYLANETSATGWYRFYVTGVRGAPDVLMMGGAGFLEGALTSPLIDDAIANYAMDTSNKTLMDGLRCVLGSFV